MSEEIVCRRCGRCCYVVIDDKLIKCRNLVRLKDGKTICRIYNGRLGYQVAKNYRCGLRTDCKFNFTDCPYNIEGKEFSPTEKLH